MSSEASVCPRVQSNALGLFTNAKHFHFIWNPDIIFNVRHKKQETVSVNYSIQYPFILKNDFILLDNKDKSRFHDDYQGYVSPKLLEIVLNHYPQVSSSVEQITERR